MRMITGTTWRVEDAREYIEDRVHKVPWSGCWLWDRALNASGYGNFAPPAAYCDGRIVAMQLAHRLAYEAYVAPIPDGMSVCHHCDVRACCNPDHLWLGTNADNVSDRARKGRSAKMIGHANGRAKLTGEAVEAILRLDAPTRELATRFGVSMSTVQRVRGGKSWRRSYPRDDP